ncbi:MAG: GDP-L-fucose synthase [Actinobacteria bacterium]|nr:GDP-L-fucose synthase [Actinomycetota bacterium]
MLDQPVRLGEPSPRTIVAPDLIRVADPEATARARRQAAAEVAPVVVDDPEAKAAIVQSVRDAFAAVRDARPELVFHLAAEVGGIGANRANPGRYWYANLMMGAHVLEAARVHGVDKLVIAGTVCSYPKFTPVPFSEDDLWDGYPEETNAAYGLAKKMLLVQAQAYRQQYGMDVVYLLPVNLYGPGDNFNLETSHVIPAMIRRFTEAREQRAPTVTLWGDGSASREFLFVSDAARAFRLALERYDGPEPVNVGSGEEVRIADLAAFIKRATGYAGSIEWDDTKPNGQPRRQLSTHRALEGFGFAACVGLAEGIATTVAWFNEEQTQRFTAAS